MKIEIWSDYACPFCYIGKRRLDGALQQFEHRDEVELIFRSYQLSPDAERDINKNIYEVMAEKRDISVEQAKENMQNPVDQAKQFGLELNFDTVVPTNTLDAHRLAHFAADQGKGIEMSERLLKAYFTDGLHIGNHEVLLDLAVEVGLNREQVQTLLQSTDYKDKVIQEREEGLAKGLKMIPHIMINGEYVYFGGQTSEFVLDALRKAWNKQANPAASDAEIDAESHAESDAPQIDFGDGCTADGCSI